MTPRIRTIRAGDENTDERPQTNANHTSRCSRPDRGMLSTHGRPRKSSVSTFTSYSDNAEIPSLPSITPEDMERPVLLQNISLHFEKSLGVGSRVIHYSEIIISKVEEKNVKKE